MTDYARTFLSRLQKLKRSLNKIGVYCSEPMIIDNADGSVDGEIRITRSKDEPDRLMLTIEDDFPLTVPRGAWITIGHRYASVEMEKAQEKAPEEKKYERFAGLQSVGVYYRRARNQAMAWLAARELEKNINERHKSYPSETYIRLKYDPDDRKPSNWLTEDGQFRAEVTRIHGFIKRAERSKGRLSKEEKIKVLWKAYQAIEKSKASKKKVKAKNAKPTKRAKRRTPIKGRSKGVARIVRERKSVKNPIRKRTSRKVKRSKAPKRNRKKG